MKKIPFVEITIAALLVLLIVGQICGKYWAFTEKYPHANKWAFIFEK
jgi:hypothetical protein